MVYSLAVPSQACRWAYCPKLAGRHREERMWWNIGVLAVVLLNLLCVVMWNKRIASRRSLPEQYRLEAQFSRSRVAQVAMVVFLVVIGAWLLLPQKFDGTHIAGLMFYFLIGGVVPWVYCATAQVRSASIWLDNYYYSGEMVGWWFSAKGVEFRRESRVDWRKRWKRFTYFLGGFAERHVEVKSETGQRLDGLLHFWATVETEPENFGEAVKSSTERFVRSAQSLLDTDASVEKVQETLVTTFKPDGGLELRIQKLRLYLPHIKLVPEPKETAK